MGLLSKNEKRDEDETTSSAWDGRRFEYRARNLKKVVGPALERDLNKFGADGWEAVCVAEDYLVFKRELKSAARPPETA